ncbi:peroxiredoxin [Spiroplasma poulsonii]|uniref:Peroxiredoxin n=1 Tax=Spiroplasma poulsonii TaxID=2138 RepID=A0A3S0ZWP6_9MOLU|nr:redoxin family protein [Spiroplasma poulsonii]MBW3058698.1 thiol peroxidase [Spiroplasma poulsonii]RUP77154.1 peroxiredoxin [Spiroplasma poulsonii]
MAKGTMSGDVATLIASNHLKVGDTLTFKADTVKWEDFELTNLKKEYKVISSIPSIDTSVCLLQTKQFNETILNKYPAVQLITISRDLPFALQRACESFVNPEHILLSDTNYREFGHKTKLYFEFNNLLARIVMVLDQNNQVIYLQIVSPVSSEPNYQDTYHFLDTLVK